MMGVINITPDSFSDGGHHLKLTEIKKTIEKFRLGGCQVFDFGAESTAPFNDAIDVAIELKRFDHLFELFNEKYFRADEIISIDTYKPEVFKTVYERAQELGLTNHFVWNDVSGQIDESTIGFLKNYPITYVFSHNLVSDRKETSDHMNFLSENIDLNKYFSKASEVFKQYGVFEKVIFDPCFGFSKSYEQNLELLDTVTEWAIPEFKWLFGISRKSFLQKQCEGPSKSDRIKQSESLHQGHIHLWAKELSDREIIVRLHDPRVFTRSVV